MVGIPRKRLFGKGRRAPKKWYAHASYLPHFREIARGKSNVVSNAMYRIASDRAFRLALDEHNGPISHPQQLAKVKDMLRATLQLQHMNEIPIQDRREAEELTLETLNEFLRRSKIDREKFMRTYKRHVSELLYQ